MLKHNKQKLVLIIAKKAQAILIKTVIFLKELEIGQTDEEVKAHYIFKKQESQSNPVHLTQTKIKTYNLRYKVLLLWTSNYTKAFL